MAGFSRLTAFLSGLLVLLVNQYAQGDVATVFYIHMAILLASTILLALLRNRGIGTSTILYPPVSRDTYEEH